MKNLLCLIILCAFHFCLCGQEAEEKVRNKKIVGGTFNFSHITNQEVRGIFNGTVTVDEVVRVRNLNISANPYIGFPLSKTSFIGLSPQIEWRRSAIASGDFITDGFFTFSLLTLGIDIFYRKNILSNKKASLFLQPFTGISSSRDLSREDIFGSGDGENNFRASAGISLGGSLYLSPKWNLVAHIWDGDYTYNSRNNKNADSSFLSVLKNHVVDLSFSFSSIRFGIERSF